MDGLIFYVLLFGRGFTVDPTKEQHQMLDKSRGKCDGDPEKARAVHGKSKLIEAENARQVKIKVKSMLIIFFDIKLIVHKEFVLAGQTVNSAYYSDVLRRMRENV
jgi:hypothetical protein